MLTKAKDLERKEVQAPKKEELYVKDDIETTEKLKKDSAKVKAGDDFEDGDLLDFNNEREIDMGLTVVIGIIHSTFTVDSMQPTHLFAEKAEWASLTNLAHETLTEVMKFEKPKDDMTKYLKPLYIKAHINDNPISWVFVDEGAILNVMPINTSKKLGNV